MIVHDWKCPNCQGQQQDDFEQAAIPYCGVCGNEYGWNEITTPQELSALNLALTEKVAKAAVVAEIGQDRADRHAEAGEWAVKTWLLGSNPRIR